MQKVSGTRHSLIHLVQDLELRLSMANPHFTAIKGKRRERESCPEFSHRQGEMKAEFYFRL